MRKICVLDNRRARQEKTTEPAQLQFRESLRLVSKGRSYEATSASHDKRGAKGGRSSHASKQVAGM